MSGRIFSYNVLTGGLCTPKFYPAYDARDLDNDARFEAVRNILAKEIARKSVVCLQEVSQGWSSKLAPFFVQRGYHVVGTRYGTPESLRMGCVLAFPRDMLLETETVTVTDLVRPPLPASDLPVCWNVAYPRPNEGIIARLGMTPPVRKRGKSSGRKRGKSYVFCVAVYHMPCAYKSPQAMVIHASLVTQWCQEWAKGDRLVIAGDFNFTPQDPAYTLMTTGTCDDLPSPIAGMDWSAELKTPMISAYKAHLGREPVCTTRTVSVQRVKEAEAKGESVPVSKDEIKKREDLVFAQTIDYIFISDGILVRSVDPVPDDGTLLPSMASTGCQPSDHFPVAANVLFTRR